MSMRTHSTLDIWERSLYNGVRCSISATEYTALKTNVESLSCHCSYSLSTDASSEELRGSDIKIFQGALGTEVR